MENEQENQCCNCFVTIESEDFSIIIEGKEYCEECTTDLFGFCEGTGEYVPIDEIEEFQNEFYSEAYLDSITTRCDECSERVRNGDGYITYSGRDICEECYIDNYFTCDACGEVYHNDDYAGDCICNDCCADSDEEIPLNDYNGNSPILEYNYKPDWKFCSDSKEHLYINNLFLGIELELSFCTSKFNELNKITYKHLPTKYIYKSDSSIDEGAELVITPHTLKALRSINFKKMFEEMIELGARSYDGGKCGLHIHINKTDSKLLTNLRRFFTLNREKIINFSQRNASQIEEWCIIPTYMDGWGDSKYQALYYTGNTIEFRIFRGTLSYYRFKSSLQFTDALVNYCDTLSKDPNVNKLSWAYFCEYLKKEKRYDFLEKYLKAKNLIVTKEQYRKTIDKLPKAKNPERKKAPQMQTASNYFRMYSQFNEQINEEINNTLYQEVMNQNDITVNNDNIYHQQMITHINRLSEEHEEL